LFLLACVCFCATLGVLGSVGGGLVLFFLVVGWVWVVLLAE